MRQDKRRRRPSTELCRKVYLRRHFLVPSLTFTRPTLKVFWTRTRLNEITFNLKHFVPRSSLRFDQVTTVQFSLRVTRLHILSDAMLHEVVIGIIFFI